MRTALNEKTNKVKKKEVREKKRLSDKDKVLLFLREVSKKTKDHSLKYDLTRCIEIIEGKENQEVAELKTALVEALNDNETLFAEKVELSLALENIKSEQNGSSN